VPGQEASRSHAADGGSGSGRGNGAAGPARKGCTVSRLRILLADDHTVVRQGLRRVLEDRPEWEVVAEAGDGREAVRQAEQYKPDIAILDVAMPLLNGIETTRQITRRVPTTRVLVLSMHADEAYVTQMLQAGATGYLLKDSADVDLIQAVSEVAKGKSFFSPAIARVMLDDYVRQLADKGVTDRYQSLSEREREIFQLIAEGKTNKEIASLLSISPSTVETHRAHIMEKLDLHSAAEIVLYAVRRGVIR
jgi:DNA-binding NarL/FixJ family response regulator